MRRTWQTRVAAILAIGGLDAWALYLGHNGVIMATSMAAIAGIAGYEIGLERFRRSDRVMEVDSATDDDR